MSEYMKIFVSFFKIGLFTFGGGYAMMPLFRQELIDKHKYVTEDELIDYYSIGQCTPGVIAVNVATFTGYKIKRVKGAILATIAIVLPSLMIIMALASVLNVLADNEIVAHAFAGIRLGVIALILNEVVKMSKKTIASKLQFGIFGLILFLLVFCDISAIMAVLIASGFGFIRYMRLK